MKKKVGKLGEHEPESTRRSQGETPPGQTVTAETAALSGRELDKALSTIDWQQVVQNGGPPCFCMESGKFCLRAERWEGHGIYHPFVSLEAMVRAALAKAKGEQTDAR